LIQRATLERRQANCGQVAQILQQAISEYGDDGLEHAEMIGELGMGSSSPGCVC
jgi:hypothetical protein